MSNEVHRLYRSRSERMFGGVCGGLGVFLGIDPSIIRLLTVFITIFWPFTPLVYLALMLVVPEDPQSNA